MADVDSILDRFRSFIYLRDVHGTEWFEDFDDLRTGCVSREQFHRVFDTIHFRLRDDEFTALADRFLEPDGRINYRNFIDTVQDIFTNKDLEKAPTGTVTDPHTIVSRRLGADDRTDEAALRSLYAKLSHQIATRGVHIREAYEDFDHHNNGTVTQSQFFRAMPFRDLSASEMQLLVKKYADPILRDVNYRRLIVDLANYTQQLRRATETFQTSLLPHQLQSLKIKSFQLPPNEMMTRFANHVRESRIRIKEFFQQHDPLSKGVIQKGKFEGTLTLFGFTFTQEDLRYLCTTFLQVIDCTDYVRYLDFCHEVERLGGVVEEQLKSPSTAQLTPPDLEAVLQRIRDTVIRFRINALPTLKDFDRLGRGFITKLQFHRALSTLRIHISTAELDLIARAYEREKGVDFYKFVEDVDATHKQDRRRYKPVAADRESIEAVYGHTPIGDDFVTPEVADSMIYQSKKGLLKKIGESHDIGSLLQEMRRWSYVNSVDFHDFLGDFDKHKIGEIPESEFRTGIGLSTFNLTDTEFALVQENYSSPRKPGFIFWRQFADDILKAIAPLELEKTPAEIVRSPKETFAPSVQAVEASNDQPSQVRRILEVVSRFVRCRRISLMEQFKDKDRHNHKRVTPTAFAQVLQLIGVHLSKAEIDVLCGFYNDAAINFVDYSQFVTDVNALIGQIFGDRASTSLVCNPTPSYGNDDCPYLVSRRKSGEMPSEWDPLRVKIQSWIFKRRIRIDEFFLAFDRLRLGKCSDQKFRSVVGQCSLPLTAEEIDYSINLFRVPETSDMFDYRTFCHQVNKIFGKRELEKKPVDKGKPRVTALADPSATMQPLQAYDEGKLGAILTRMKNLVTTRRMNIREQFADYDKAPHKNFITKQQFKQCIARLGLSTDPREYDVLCKRYRCTDLDDMNYHAFCDDIDKS